MNKFLAVLIFSISALGIFVSFPAEAKPADIVAENFFNLGKKPDKKPEIIKDGPGKPIQIIIDNPSKGPISITPGQGGPVPVPVPISSGGALNLLILVAVLLSIRRVQE